MAEQLRRLQQAFSTFDSAYGSGDGDGIVELPDVQPEAVARAMQRWCSTSGVTVDAYMTAQQLQGEQLWTAYQSIRHELGEAPLTGARCEMPQEQLAPLIRQSWARMQEGAQTRTFWNQLVVREFMTGPIVIAGDSLTAGMQGAAMQVGALAGLMARWVLHAAGILDGQISILSIKEPWPYDALGLIAGGIGVWAAGGQLVDALLGCSEKAEHHSADVKGVLSRAVIVGAPAATTRDYVAPLTPESAQTEQSPGMVFLNKFAKDIFPSEWYADGAAPHSMLDYAIAQYQERVNATGKSGTFVVALGANNLLTKILLDRADADPEQYRDDLRKIDESTRALIGARRVYLFPPDPRALMIAVKPEWNLRDESGQLIPAGSYLFNGWLDKAQVDQSGIPSKHIITAARYDALGKRYSAMRKAAYDVLGNSNWVIIDHDREQDQWTQNDTRPRGLFSAMIEQIGREGIVVDNVPGYGQLVIKGPGALLSTDNEHPSNIGYAIWGQLLFESFCAEGFFDEGRCPAATVNQLGDFQRSSAAQLQQLYQRVVTTAKAAVRRDPSFYRPLRADPAVLKSLMDGGDMVAWLRGSNDVSPGVAVLSTAELGALYESMTGNPFTADQQREPHHVQAELVLGALDVAVQTAEGAAQVEVASRRALDSLITRQRNVSTFIINFFNGMMPRTMAIADEVSHGKTPGLWGDSELRMTLGSGYELRVDPAVLSGHFFGDIALHYVPFITNTLPVEGPMPYMQLLEVAVGGALHIENHAWDARASLDIGLVRFFADAAPLELLLLNVGAECRTGTTAKQSCALTFGSEFYWNFAGQRQHGARGWGWGIAPQVIFNEDGLTREDPKVGVKLETYVGYRF